MSRMRLTEQGIVDRTAAIGAIEAHIGRLETIQRARDTDAVKLMVDSIKAARKHENSRLTEIAMSPINDAEDLKQLRVIGGRLQAYAQILNDFDDPLPQVEKAREKIAALRNEIETARKGELVES